MRFSAIAALATFSSLVSANYDDASACPAGVVTQTVTVTTQASSATYAGLPPAKTLEVELVAFSGNFKYVPDRVNANIGDVIKFKFRAAAHSATQSTFNTPCTPLQGGWDSELIPNMANSTSPEFERLFVVNTAAPLWFYCKQTNGNHCGKGMVFGINPGDTMDAFIANAIKQNGGLSSTSAAAAPPSSSSTSSPPPPPADTVSAAGSSPSLVGGTPAACASVPGATTTVIVSGGFNDDGTNNLAFHPSYLPHVNKCDRIIFDFRRQNHTLTESTLENPCKKKADTLIDTNFQNVNAGNVPLQNATTFIVDTDSYTPRFFYCKQLNGQEKGHCSNGMVFAINVNEWTHNTFVNNALATLPSKKPARFARRWFS